MATKKKMLQAAAGNAGGDPLDITDVFSNYLYDGNGTTGQTINNGIDLAGEGGLVWFKQLNANRDHGLFDTVRGQGKYIRSNTYNTEASSTTMLTAFNSNGFTLGGGGAVVNNGSGTYVSWTFRKAKKFFDIVEYTGNGVAGRTISHNLGCTVGAMFIKRTNVDDNWPCFHRSLGGGKVIQLNVTDQAYNVSAYWNSTPPTDSVFTLGSDNATNNSGDTYIAYIFAHNNNDGGFGPDGDQDIIKCGSFTTQSSAFEVDLGFEPQWIMLKLASAGSWYMYDVMRGIGYDEGNQSTLYANQTYSEYQIGSNNFVNPTPTGFKINQNMINQALGGNQNVIYMAIRRGPLTPPEDATKVFAVDQENSSEPYYTSGFPVDLALAKNSTGTQYWRAYSRLTQTRELYTNVAGQEGGEAKVMFDYMDGHYSGSEGSDVYSWMWKRAPGFCDVLNYRGGGSGTQVVNHNLGVTPELIIQKGRTIGTNWTTAAKITGTTFHKGQLNAASGLQQITYASDQRYFTNFSDTTVTVGNDLNSNDDHIMYLFASLAGVSKIGTFSTNYSDLVVDCGFTTGARFVLFKRVPTGNSNWDNWFVFDSVRGITTSNDNFLKLNASDSQTTDGNNIESHSSGFKVKSGGGLNFANGDEILFYAIA